MRSFFNLDGPVMSVLNRIADLLVLNILFILTSIPVITIGASFSAMYTLTLKIVRNEESYIARKYFKAFKENFKQATLVWFIMITFIGFFYVDCRIFITFGLSENVAMKIIFRAACVLLIMIAGYLFPLIARFENTTVNMVRNALIMMTVHLPSTLVILAVTVIPPVLTFWTPTILYYGSLFWMLFGFSITACVNSFFLRKIFDRYSPVEKAEENAEAEENESELTGPDVPFRPWEARPGTEPDERDAR